MRLLAAFPFLALSLIAYNVIGLTDPSVFGGDVFVAQMMSGATFALNGGEIFILASLFLLFIEVIKAASVGASTILDHILSTAVFIVALVEFLLINYAGTATFLILVVMCLIDVVAGYSVSIRSARRDLNVGQFGDTL